MDLPTAAELQRLPLRAVAAYSARGARRIKSVLFGAIDEEAIEEALSIVEEVASAERLDHRRAASAARAASRMVKAAIPLRTPECQLAAHGICDALLAAIAVLQATVEPGRALFQAAHAARAAERAAHATDVLDEQSAVAANRAARADYETLVRTFGAHDIVRLGEPIDLSESSLLGPLM